jgi:hypothetical protein
MEALGLHGEPTYGDIRKGAGRNRSHNGADDHDHIAILHILGAYFPDKAYDEQSRRTPGVKRPIHRLRSDRKSPHQYGYLAFL